MNKLNKYLIMIKMIVVLLVVTATQLDAKSLGQTVNFKSKNSTITDFFREIKKQTGYTVLCKSDIVNNKSLLQLDLGMYPLEGALEKVLTPRGLTYAIDGKSIVIKRDLSRKVNTRTVDILYDNEVAQQEVQGKVTNAEGNALAGVNVAVKGLGKGTVTNANGEFKIAASMGAVLEFSMLGYKKEEVAVRGTTVNVKLQFVESDLDEVIVTGYGTIKKSDYTGAVSNIKTDKMTNVPAVDFSTMLQGNAPGVQVNSLSGQPGGATNIRIRGMGSVNASNSPLYVIDGVPVMSGNLASSSSNNAGLDVMSMINNADIDQITVIKDAAAASLYGSRAAGGVILITTKSGKAGRPVINLRADYGVSSQATDFREVMNGPARRMMLLEGLRNRARYIDKLTDETKIEEYAQANIDKYAPEPSSGWADWKNELFRKNAPFNNTDFSISGGDSKISYFTSLAHMKQSGLSYQSGFERLSGRLNVKYKMSDKLEVGANILYSNVDQDVNSEGGTYTSPIYATRHKITASEPVYNEDGTFFTGFFSNGPRNPKAASLYNYRNEKVDRSFNTIFATYKIIDDLSFNTTFSLDNTTTNYNSWQDPRSSDGEKANGSLTSSFTQYKQIVWKNTLSYIKTFDDKHNVDVLAGYEVNKYNRNDLSGAKDNFPTVDKIVASNGSIITDLSGSTSEWRLLSYLTRGNYNYDNKYFFGASLRMDGSSRLHKDSRWGSFWSISGAWRLSNESFMDDLKSVVQDAKIRASYGTNGTLPSSYYAYMGLTGFGYPYFNSPGIREMQIGNPDLRWEKQNNLNLGLDLRLLNRFNVTFEWYNRQSSDLLNDMPTSLTTGFSSYLTNIGRLRNRGIEVDINADIIRNGDFSWNAGVNMGMNKNKTIALADGSNELRSGVYNHQVGKPWYSFYLVEFAGINKETGVPQYYINDPENLASREVTEDYTKANRIVYKAVDPKISGGINNSFRYKFVDFNFTWTYSLGGHSYDSGASKTELAGKTGYDNIPKYYERRWQKPGDETDIEMFMVGNSYDMSSIANTRRIHSTDHIRLKNVTLGVSIPQHLTRKLRLNNVRAYCSGVNLLTFAAYNNYDPEVPVNGSIYFESPKLKTVTVGLDIKF